MAAPEILTTFDGSLLGAVDGVNTEYFGPALSQPGMIFLNGALMTRGPDFSSQLNYISLAGDNTPQTGNIVTEAVYGASSIPFNLPTQFTTADGTITGLRNGANNIFTLVTTALVTDLLVALNSQVLALDVDYTWMCQMTSSAGGWTTTITINGPYYLVADDRLTAQVWTQ